MKTITQNYKTGELNLVEVPRPQLQGGWVLVKTAYSLISAGTEKTKIDTGRKSLLGKAMARPDLVKQVINKARRDGLWKTWQAVDERLSTPSTLGYACAGEVLEVQGDVGNIRPGDRVACGGSTANHAEIVCVPKNLVVPVPDGVSLEQAACTTVAAIAMQGVRQAETRIGERVAVIGLGLIGLMTVQMLKASGARVFGIDIDPRKLSVARELGCDDAALADDEALMEQVLLFTDGYGVDATLVTAAARSNQPVEQSAEITREKGKVVVVGLTNMDVPREPFYEKELDLRLSRSYGPGRYDRRYEEEGHDYPFAYVRFTEKRNMATVLDLVKHGQLNLAPLITHRFPIDRAAEAYEMIHAGIQPYLGVILEYPRPLKEMPARIEIRPRSVHKERIVIGVIGAGHYATSSLLPLLRRNDAVSLGSVCTATGATAEHVGQRFGFAEASANPDAIINESDAVVIATRHNDHAFYAAKALRAGKSIFVEKPLAITEEQLDEVIEAGEKGGAGSVMVGFNRRFAPATQAVLEHFSGTHGPRHIMIRVNAGSIPRDHWTQDPAVGGGRLIGEGCHFVDLAVALSKSLVKRVVATAIPIPGLSPAIWDDFSMVLTMEDGSIASIVYTSVGDKGLSKERIEVFAGGRAAVIDDFNGVELWSGGRHRRKTWRRQDKGQANEVAVWTLSLKEGRTAIPFGEIMNVHRACLGAIRSIVNGESVTLNPGTSRSDAA